MVLNHTLETEMFSEGINISQTVVKTGSQQVYLDEVINAGTDTPAVLNLDVSRIKSLAVLANKNCTVKTNSSVSPDDTLSLKANVLVQWHDTSPFLRPFLLDVTQIFITNSDQVRLKLLALVDARVPQSLTVDTTAITADSTITADTEDFEE